MEQIGPVIATGIFIALGVVTLSGGIAGILFSWPLRGWWQLPGGLLGAVLSLLLADLTYQEIHETDSWTSALLTWLVSAVSGGALSGALLRFVRFAARAVGQRHLRQAETKRA